MTKGQWTRKNREIPGGAIQLELGVGVMSKDGKTPWAPGTLHYMVRSGWMHAAPLCWKNAALLMADPDVVSIEVIDHDNTRVEIKLDKEWVQPERPAEA